MYRAFNMGIGMTFIVSTDDIGAVTDALKDLTDVYEIGSVVNAENEVILK
jgi:phosphoribosylaminoimidazole (AIR) synthetase